MYIIKVFFRTLVLTALNEYTWIHIKSLL